MAAVSTKLHQGLEHYRSGRIAEAASIFEQVLTLEPNNADALHLLGLTATSLGRHDVAARLVERAIVNRPNEARFFNNSAEIQRKLGLLERAREHAERAIALDPHLADAHANLGNAFFDLGCPEKALAAYGRAVELQPDHSNARWNRSLTLLLLGRFSEGWADYEFRWHTVQNGLLRRYDKPRWTGESIARRTLFVYAEQGLGDTLQFVRYLPLIAKRDIHVVFECQPELHRLLRCLPGITLVSRGDSTPDFDYHIPLLSLPGVIGTTLETIPAEVPYISPPRDALVRWRERLSQDSAHLRIGLCWAGSSHHTNDRNRSARLAQLQPLRALPGVLFYSLQKGDAAWQAQQPPMGMRIIDATPLLTDFAETAALVASLNLIVSVDTSVAHLAGALGRPVWTMLPFAAEWRYLIGRSDSPWYPTMRLFRQSRPGDWRGVAARILAQLKLEQASLECFSDNAAPADSQNKLQNVLSCRIPGYPDRGNPACDKA